MSSSRSGVRRRGDYNNLDIERGIELTSFSESTPLIKENTFKPSLRTRLRTSLNKPSVKAAGVGFVASAVAGGGYALADYLGHTEEIKNIPNKALERKVNQLRKQYFSDTWNKQFPQITGWHGGWRDQAIQILEEEYNKRSALTLKHINGIDTYFDKTGKQLDPYEVQPYFDKQNSKDYTLPGYNYLGPGNILNKGPPLNDIDADAQQHDIAYDKAQTSKEVSKADEIFVNQAKDHIVESINLNDKPLNTIGSIVGAVGIGTKQAVEKHTGIIYPSIVSGMGKYDNYKINKQYQSWWNGANDEQKNEVINNPQYHYLFAERPSASSDQSNAALPASASKRPADSSVTGEQDRANPKRRQLSLNSAGISSSGQHPDAGTIPESIEVDEEMPLTGTGREQAEGGASANTRMDIYQIERPISNFGSKISVYRKSHKFMIFGLANAVIGPAAAATRQHRLLTTALAEIPWHKLPLYMNQSEFDLLPPGSHAVKAEVQVYFRGNRIAFETASSVSGLATLNQISNVQVGYALNKTGWGINRSITAFNPNQPMIPATLAAPRYAAVGTTYRGMIQDYYGANNNESTNFANSGNYPHHQVGSWCFLQNYFCMYTMSSGTGNDLGPLGGWPCLQEKLEQYDGKTIVNECIANMEYTFKLAPIKTPLGVVRAGYPLISADVNTNGNLSGMRSTNIAWQVQDPQSQAVVETSNDGNRTFSGEFGIYNTIEKSQFMRSGPWGQADPHVQPSLHVGVQAVPSLTTASLNGPINKWTDSMGYIDVIATLTVKEHDPTAFPYATVANVPIGDVIMRTSGTLPNDNNSTIAGLYPNISTLGTIS